MVCMCDKVRAHGFILDFTISVDSVALFLVDYRKVYKR